MAETILNNETALRLAVFAAVFIVMAMLELVLPKRDLQQSKASRWLSNIAVSVVNSLLLKLVFPLLAVSLAIWVNANHWGLFNTLPFALPELLGAILFLLVFDLTIYWQHRLFHRIPILWRLHRMHHTDRDIDVTTGNRFHPFEIILSMLVKCLLILVMGPVPVAVFVAEVVLNASSLFNHSNIALPAKVDKYLRTVLVTPDMHRLHHSTRVTEQQRNFSFNLSCWDHFFGSYQAQPKDGHFAMQIGIKEAGSDRSKRFFQLLLEPFR